jgi:hypothetical protein
MKGISKNYRISARLQGLEDMASGEQTKTEEKSAGYDYYDGVNDALKDVISEIHSTRIEVDAFLSAHPSPSKEDVVKILQKLCDLFEKDEQIYRNWQSPVDNTVDRYNTGKANAYSRWHQQILDLIDGFQREDHIYQ